MYLNNLERKKQILDFEGIGIGNMRPMDIDFFMEYKNKAYIFIEAKYGSAEMPTGQTIAYTRVIDDLTKAGKDAILIIAEHRESDCSENVLLKDAKVRRYYRNGEWKTYRGDVGTLFNFFISHNAVNKWGDMNGKKNILDGGYSRRV